MSWLLLKPYRCSDCDHRFYAYRASAKSATLVTLEERRIMKVRRDIRRRRIQDRLFLYGLLSLILLAALYFMTHSKRAASEDDDSSEP